MADNYSSEGEDSDFSDPDHRVESLESLMEMMEVPKITRRSTIPIIDTTLDSSPQKRYPAHEVLDTPAQGESELSSTNVIEPSGDLSAAAATAILEQYRLENDYIISLSACSSPLIDTTHVKNNSEQSNNVEETLDSSITPCLTNDLLLTDVTFEIDSDILPATSSEDSASFPVGGPDRTPPSSINSSDNNPLSKSDDMRENRGKRSRNPIPDPKIWAREDAKLKRMKGEDYVGFRRKDKKSTKIMIHDTPKGARSIGPVCPPGSKCGKWANRECHQIDENKRNALFVKFWKNMDWGEKKMYIASLVIANDPARKKTERNQNTPSKKLPKPKDVSYSYHLKIDNKKFQVCRTTFLNTFGLENSTVRHWLAEYSKIGQTTTGVHDNTKNNVTNREEATSSIDGNPRRVGENQLSNGKVSNQETRTKVLIEFLHAMPKLPSHYCRQSSNRLYLQTDITSMGQFYRLYKEHCALQKLESLSRFTFDKKCKEMRLSLFSPKKDQCDICTGYKHKNVAKEKYDLHILLKNQAREQKHTDKILAEEGHAHVICCDMMAVKLLPAIETSVAYYKMKLAIHNYTVYNLGNHDANCFWFVESECKLLSSVFATCLVEEIDSLLSQRNQDVIIYSDGCGYQNRNAALSNALLSLSMLRNVTIFQKFLERGHTQMEGDSVHSVIENACKKKDGIYLPHEMVHITKESRKLPFPYRSKLMYHTDFKNYTDPEKLRYHSIRPGTKTNDPVVTDIRCLKYSPSGTISYKLRFDETFRDLPRRPKNVTSAPEDFPPLFLAPIPIPKDKWDDLQSLKTFIPKDCHEYFNNIPHLEESYRKGIANLKGKKRPQSPVAAGSSGTKIKKTTKKD